MYDDQTINDGVFTKSIDFESPGKLLPIETVCKGVIIAVVGYDSRGVIIYWPKREGYSTPIEYELFDDSIFTDYDFREYPEFAGVYECTISFHYEKGNWYTTDDDYWFIVEEYKTIIDGERE